jgi:hypothetical protein
MFASLEVCKTSRSALADLLPRMYFWTRPSLSRSLAGRHPCWTAACFLPCTRPPDLPRLRLRRPTRRPGPFRTRHPPRARIRGHAVWISNAKSFGARARAAMLTPPAPERPSTPADLRTALRPPASFGVTLFAINVGCPADRPRPPSRIHSEDHIISQRFSPPSTGCISGGHTSLSLYW